MIYLDGDDLPVQKVLNMAKGARDNSIAEHYLVALFYEADVREDRWLRRSVGTSCKSAACLVVPNYLHPREIYRMICR